MAKKANTEDVVRQLIAPVAEEQGVRLWDVRFVKEGSEFYLRITLDKDGGVFIQDCEAFSRAIDPLLDAADPIKEGYYLEVSSPGLGRPLTRPEHFAALMGQAVRVHTIRPVDGQRDFVGLLSGYDGGVTLLIDGTQRRLDKSEIASVKLNDDEDLF